LIRLHDGHGGEIAWRASFPDFDVEPPAFPELLNDGAYFHLLIEPETEAADGLSLSLAAGDHPDFVFRLPGAGADEFLQVAPGRSAAISGGSSEVRRGGAAWVAFLQGILHVVP